MRNFFVPYAGSAPAVLSIKGQNFLILSRAREPLEDQLDRFGADHLQEIVSLNSQDELKLLDGLAKEIGGGVVVTPVDVDVEDVIVNLERQISWVH